MKQLLTALICTGFVAIISCQKDVTEEKEQETKATDTLLAKILVYDTIHPGKDMSLTEFIYDDLDRVKEIKDTYFDSTNGGITIHDQYFTYYYYNGADKKPYKSFGWTRYVYDDHDVFHFYDAQGRLIMDSLGSPDQSYMLNKFEYSQDKLIVTSYEYDDDQDLVYSEISDSCYFGGGNVTREYLLTPLTQESEDAFEYSYDDKINPLSKLNIAACMGVDKFTPLDKFWVLASGYSKNNIVKRIGYSSTVVGGPYVKEFKFTYNENDLPVLGIFKEVGQPDEGIRVRYEYTE